MQMVLDLVLDVHMLSASVEGKDAGKDYDFVDPTAWKRKSSKISDDGATRTEERGDGGPALCTEEQNRSLVTHKNHDTRHTHQQNSGSYPLRSIKCFFLFRTRALFKEVRRRIFEQSMSN